MESKKLADRIAYSFIGLSMGACTRLLSQDYNSTSYLVGFSLAGACGVLIPTLKKTGQDEKYVGIASSSGSYPVGYVATDYLLKALQ